MENLERLQGLYNSLDKIQKVISSGYTALLFMDNGEIFNGFKGVAFNTFKEAVEESSWGLNKKNVSFFNFVAFNGWKAVNGFYS